MPGSARIRVGSAGLVRLAAVAALAGALGGCAAFGSISDRATNINKGVGSAQNRSLLLNLARASRLEPIYFLQMSQLAGSATEDLKVGLPQDTLGPLPKNTIRNYVFGGNGTNVLDNNTATSFQESVLTSKDFYTGLMVPLGLNDVHLLLSQGFPRELVLYLVVDRLEVTDVTDVKTEEDRRKAVATIFYNNPRSPTYDRFAGLITAAMDHGLTTEPAPYRAATESEIAADPGKAAADAAAGGAALALQALFVKMGNSVKPPSQAPAAQLCYDWALAKPASIADFPDQTSRCGAAPLTKVGAPETSNLAVNLPDPRTHEMRRYEIDVRTRSIYGMFAYLGALIANDDEGKVQLGDYDQPPAESETPRLLNVVRAREGAEAGCFAAVEYEGQAYCVPNDASAANTKRIFNILNALLALKTSQGDLPVTQTVRIAP